MDDRRADAGSGRLVGMPQGSSSDQSVTSVRTTVIRGADGGPVDLNQLPPEVRAQIERFMASQGGAGPAGAAGFDGKIETFSTIQITGPDGLQRTYRSLDEMPPEDRRLFEELRQHGRGSAGVPRSRETKVVFGATLDPTRQQSSSTWPWLLLGAGVGGLVVYYFMR